jgi:hypothetical protein
MRKKASPQSRLARSARSSAAAGQPLEGRGLLVIVELGGEWPSQAVSGDSGPSTRRVLAQIEGETPAAFAERLASGLDGLFGRGIELQTVVLACNERLDEAAEAARRKALSVALGSMAKHKSGRAYLAASARSGGRLRHALSALAQGLSDEWRTAGLEVSVDFGEENRLAASAQPVAPTARVA